MREADCRFISAQNSRVIVTAVGLPTAKVLLTVRNELPVDNRHNAIATRFSIGIALRKFVQVQRTFHSIVFTYLFFFVFIKFKHNNSQNEAYHLTFYEKVFAKVKIKTKVLLKSSEKKQKLYDKFLKNKTYQNEIIIKTIKIYLKHLFNFSNAVFVSRQLL